MQPRQKPAALVRGLREEKSRHHIRVGQVREFCSRGLNADSRQHPPVDEIHGKAPVRPVNHPSYRPTRSPFWLVVHAGQCRPKIVGIASFYSHGSNLGTYRTSWTILQSSLKAAHHVNPQRTRAPSQEKIRTHSYPCISFRRCWRCSDLKLYCCQTEPIACSQTLRALETFVHAQVVQRMLRKHSAAVKFDTPHSSTQKISDE